MKKELSLLMIILLLFINITAIHAVDDINNTDTAKTPINLQENRNNNDTPIIVNNSNYYDYFDEFDATTTDRIKENHTIILSGNFKNKEFLIDKKGITLTATNNTLLRNSAILILQTAGNNTIKNITINNKNTYEYGIFNEAESVHIHNNNITMINDYGLTQPILNIGNHTIINNNTIHAEGPAVDIDWNGGSRCGLANTMGILNDNTYNTLIENNTILVNKSKFGDNQFMGTISGIETKGGKNITINNNDITVTDARFCYAIDALNHISNIKITNNKLQIKSERYVNGIQIGNHAYNSYIENNTIIGNCFNTTLLTAIDDEAMAFGIITTSMGGEKSENMTIQNNNITLNSTICYGLEIYSTHKSKYNQNNITIEGAYTLGIAIALSPNNNITKNNILANGNTNIKIHEVVEEITPATMAIKIQQESDNITITQNYFNITDKKENNISIDINNCHNINIQENIIIINNNSRDNTIKSKNSSNTTILNNNQPTPTLNITPLQNNDNTLTITATITNTYNTINKGKITFKVNGKTLKDTNGKVIYAKVINGTATIENYEVPDTWNENTTIEATYSGSTQLEKLNSEKTNITITPKETTLTTEPITATTGTSTTLTATLSDNTINTGKIVFKVNGKTVKDTNGKVIYAKVVNGTVSVEYTLPESMKAKEYTITAVYMPTSGDRLEDNATLTVVN